MGQKTNILSKDKLLQKAIEKAQIGAWYLEIGQDELIINPAFAALIGRSVPAGQRFTLNDWLSVCHRNDRKTITNTLAKFLSSPTTHFNLKIRVEQPHGKWLWTQFSGSIAETGLSGEPTALSGTLMDISDFYHQGNCLTYRYKIERLVSEISSDFVGVQMSDMDTVINRSLKKIGQFLEVDRCYVFQFRRHNIIMDNTHEWCAEGIRGQINNLQNMPSSAFPWWMKKLNKLEHIYIRHAKNLPEEAAIERETLLNQQIVSLLVVPIHYQKNLLGFIGFDSVKGEKEWLESDIHLISTVGGIIASAFNAKIHQEEVISAKEKAEEGNRVKAAFLATINHELRTPLHHILGFSDLIRMNKIPTSEIASFAHKIYNSGRNLLDLIEDVLNLALADGAMVKIRNEDFTGIELFNEHKMILQELLVASNKEKSIHLKFKSSRNFLGTRFSADKKKINQVLVNLLKNAVKFTDSGSIELIAEIKNGKLVFRIKDTGIGIPRHQQELIFDFFRQINDTSTRIYSGIGVGLSIAKRITTILGGTLSVISIPQKGSTFTFEAPTEIIDSEGAAPQKDTLFDFGTIIHKSS